MDQLSIHVSRKDDTLQSILMPFPSDFHTHVRDDILLRAVAGPLLRWLRYALIMPNTGPIDTIEKMLKYKDRIERITKEFDIVPRLIMTLYLTPALTPRVIEEMAALSFPCAVKYYPPEQGATTGSGFGIPLAECGATLRAMEEHGVRLLLHGELVKDSHRNDLPHEVRESEFVKQIFRRLCDQYPNLLMCFEHVSTEEAIAAVKEDTSGTTTCTVTPHHLLLTMDELLEYSWKNHGKCMPYLKSEADRHALREFATSGDRRCILGTDCAPHPSKTKVGVPFEEARCGAYVPHALAMYIRVFEAMSRLDERFLRFACTNGPDWWNLPRPRNEPRIFVKRTFHDIPEPTPVPEINDIVIPLGWSEEHDPLVISYAQTQTLKRCL